MADVEKVKKGLFNCFMLEESSACHKCPYFTTCYPNKDEQTLTNRPLYTEAIELIDELQAEIERLKPRKGRWIFGDTNGHGWMKCDQCCVSQEGQTLCYSFCPNCGADMRGGDGDG